MIGRTVEYGDSAGIRVTTDRHGLPEDCPCPAVWHASHGLTIAWPAPGCPHHNPPYVERDATVLPFTPRTKEPRP